jgi:hypothetical protein
MRERRDAEVVGNRLAEIGERGAGAKVRRPHAGAGHQQRNIFARVVGARRAGIVAVIGGDDEQVRVAKRRQQPRKFDVEPLQVGGIASHIIAVAVYSIEVDEIDEDETLRCLSHDRRELCHAVGVA